VLYFGNTEQGPGGPGEEELSSSCDGAKFAGYRREQDKYGVASLAFHKLDFLIRGWVGIPGRAYPFSMRYDAVGACEAIVAEAKRVRADVVIFPSIFSHYAPALESGGFRVIADAYDVLSEITADLMESHRGEGYVKRLSLYANHLACLSQERIFLPRCSEVWATSGSEAQSLSRICGGIDVLAVPNFMDGDRIRPAEAAPARGHVGFIGLYSFQPNLEAATFLAEKVFPEVLARCPEARLRLAGAAMPRPVEERLKKLPNVDVLGQVPDSGKFMEECAVIALPMFVRGGVPLKLVEAMARGKAVVTTPVMVAGLPVQDGVDLVIRDRAEGVTQAIVDLIVDPKAASRMGNRARDTFLEQWSMESVVGNIRRKSILSWKG